MSMNIRIVIIASLVGLALFSCGSSTQDGSDGKPIQSASATHSPPAGPTNLAATLSATGLGLPKAELVWEDRSDNETGFKIERRLTTESAFSELASPGEGVTTYEDTDLHLDESYVYRVFANNVYGASDPSNEVTVGVSSAPPPIPVNLRVTSVTSGEIDLAWDDTSNYETGFVLEIKDGNLRPGFDVSTVSLPTNTTTYQHTGLSSGIGYSYRVKATGLFQDSGFSASVSSTTTAPPPAPTGLIYTARGITSAAPYLASVSLSWNRVFHEIWNSEDAYNVFATPATPPGSARVLKGTVDPDTTTFTVDNLDVNTLVLFEVCAVKATFPDACVGLSERTLPIPLPNAPTNLDFNGCSYSMFPSRVIASFSFTDNSTNETGFRLEGSVVAGWLSTDPSGIGLVTRTVEVSGGYEEVYVVAYNEGGTGVESNHVCFDVHLDHTCHVVSPCF
jgi:hypothetical protein